MTSEPPIHVFRWIFKEVKIYKDSRRVFGDVGAKKNRVEFLYGLPKYNHNDPDTFKDDVQMKYLLEGGVLFLKSTKLYMGMVGG